MLNLPMDSGELNIDGLRDTSSIWSAILEANLRKIHLQAPHTKLDKGPLPEF